MRGQDTHVKRALMALFVNSWWVLAFMLLCLIFYERGIKNTHALHQHLYESRKKLENEKLMALEEMHHLQMQINSQSDPKWIELTLKKEMGLVSEGERKVYFFKEK